MCAEHARNVPDNLEGAHKQMTSLPGLMPELRSKYQGMIVAADLLCEPHWVISVPLCCCTPAVAGFEDLQDAIDEILRAFCSDVMVSKSASDSPQPVGGKYQFRIDVLNTVSQGCCV